MNDIEKIRIKNFKSLEDVEIEPKTLTFLFGSNSSGKSSFLKALMILYKNLFPLNNGKTIYKLSNDVDLVSFDDIVTKGDRSKTVSFEMYLKGKYHFPCIKIFDYDFLEKHSKYIFKDSEGKKYNVVNDIFYVLEEFKKGNISFFEFFDDIYPCILNDSFLCDINVELSSLIEEKDFRIKVEVKFGYDKEGINLSTIIINNINEEYTIEITLNSYRYHTIEKNKSAINNKTYDWEVSENRKSVKMKVSGLEIYKYFEQLITGCTDSNFNMFVPFFHGSNIPTLPIMKELLDKYGSFWGLPILPKEFCELEEKEKLVRILELARFYYINYRFVPYKLFKSLSNIHLPTVREIPQKIYVLTQGNFEDDKYYGLLNKLSNSQDHLLSKDNIRVKNIISEEVAEKIHNTLNELLNFENINEQNPLIRINYWLKKFGFDKIILIDKSKEIGKLIVRNKNYLGCLTNESSGLIQCLPIVICCILNTEITRKQEVIEGQYLNNDFSLDFINLNSPIFNLLLIEQPELHLHPNLQCKLAELFVFRATHLNKCMVIETHSEHIIRKIQVLIAKGEINREKISVYYFDNKEGSTKTKKMEIKANGLFKEDWPDGFFDESTDLTLELFESIKKPKK